MKQQSASLRILWKTLPQRMLGGWFRHQRLVFLVLLLAVTITGIWKGYRDVYVFRWSDAQKQEYRDKSLQSIQFRQDLFDRTVSLLSAKKADFQAQTGNEHDIFGAGPTQTKP